MKNIKFDDFEYNVDKDEIILWYSDSKNYYIKSKKTIKKNMNDNNCKLLIYLGANGYNIMCTDGTPMEFTDGTVTQNIQNLKEAISICTNHYYSFEVL